MWKHYNYLLCVHISNMPVIQWMCGISLKLGGRGICVLATPFTVTIWEFFCATQRVSPVLVGRLLASGSRCASSTLSCLPRIRSIWQLPQPRLSVDRQESRQLFFACIPIYLFWGEGKKLNKNILCIELTGYLMLSVGRGSVQETFDQRSGSLIIWK